MIHLSLFLSLVALGSCNIFPQPLPSGSLIRRTSSDGDKQVFINKDVLHQLIRNFFSSNPHEGEHINSNGPSIYPDKGGDNTQDLLLESIEPSSPCSSILQHKQELLSNDNLKPDRELFLNPYQKRESALFSNRYTTQDETPIKLYQNPEREPPAALPETYTDKRTCNEQQQTLQYTSPNAKQQTAQKNNLKVYQPSIETAPSSEFQRTNILKNYQYPQEISPDAVHQLEKYEYNPEAYIKDTQDSFQQTPNNKQQPMHNSELGIFQAPIESLAVSQRFAAPKNYQPYSQEMSSDAVNLHKKYEINPVENTKLTQDSFQQTPNNKQQPMHNSELGISQAPIESLAVSQRFAAPKNYQPYTQGMPSDAGNLHKKYEFNPNENMKLTQDSFQQTPNIKQQPMHNSELGIYQTYIESSAASQRFEAPKNYQPYSQGMSSDVVNLHKKYELNPDENTKLTQDSFQRTPSNRQQPMHNYSKTGNFQSPIQSSVASRKFGASNNYQPYSQDVSYDTVEQHDSFPSVDRKLTQPSSNKEEQNVQVTPYVMEQQKHGTVSVSPNPTFVQAFIPQMFQNDEDEEEGQFGYPIVSKQIQTGAIKIIRRPVTE